MIIWVCGTVGLWDCGTLRISRKMEGRKIIQVGQENLDRINRMDRIKWDKNEMITWFVLLMLSFLFAEQETLGGQR